MSENLLTYKATVDGKELKRRIAKKLSDYNKGRNKNDVLLYFADDYLVKFYIGESENGGYYFDGKISDTKDGATLTGSIKYQNKIDKNTKWYKYIPVVILGVILLPLFIIYLAFKGISFLIKKAKKIPVSNEEILDDFLVNHIKLSKI